MSTNKSFRTLHVRTVFRKTSLDPNWSIGTYMDTDEDPGWITQAEYSRPDFNRTISVIPIYYFTHFSWQLPMENMFLTPEDAALRYGLPAETMVRLHGDPSDDDYTRFAVKRDIIRTRAWNDVHEGARSQLEEELVVECPEVFDDDGELIGLSSNEEEIDEEIDEEEIGEKENDEQESKGREEVSSVDGDGFSAATEFARLSTENGAEQSPKPRIDSLIHDGVPGIESAAGSDDSSLGIKRKAAEMEEDEVPEPVRGRIPRTVKRSRPVLAEEDDEQEDASYVPLPTTARRQNKIQRTSTSTSSQQAAAQVPNKKPKKPKKRADAANKEDRLRFPWTKKHRLCCAIAKKHFGLDWVSLESVFSHLWEDDLEKSEQVAGSDKWVKNISTQWRECRREKSQHLWKPVKDEVEAQVQSTEYSAALTEVENAMSELGVESNLGVGELQELDWEVTYFK